MRALAALALAAIQAVPVAPARELALPKKAGSIRFAVIGDSGRGHRPQYEVAAQMQAFREELDYEFVLMLGDNVYDSWTPEDYRQKFELPYKPLLDEGVEFYAVRGNHDSPRMPEYPPFNMKGQRYYTFKPERSLGATLAGTSVRFFMLDTEDLDPAQVEWLDRELGRSGSDWKIVAGHRPLYTAGRYASAARALRERLEPILVRHGVQAVFAGHEHFYERTHPQRGIVHFVSGGAGSLRRGDIRPLKQTAAGFDDDYHFMLVEIAGDELHYQAVSRTGETVDAGTIRRK